MIIDSIDNSGLYEKVNESFAKVFEILKTLDENTQPQKIVIDEGNVWINVQKIGERPAVDQQKFEEHRKFIDVHYIVHGKESFGYCNTDRVKVVIPYSEEKDIEFSEGEISKVYLSAGDFCVTYPHDAHMPSMENLSDGTMTRAVAKIRL